MFIEYFKVEEPLCWANIILNRIEITAILPRYESFGIVYIEWIGIGKRDYSQISIIYNTHGPQHGLIPNRASYVLQAHRFSSLLIATLIWVARKLSIDRRWVNPF